MPETPPDTSNQDGNTTSGSTSTAGDEFKPITSQEELNKVVGDEAFISCYPNRFSRATIANGIFICSMLLPPTCALT